MNVEKCKEWSKDRLIPSPKNPLTNRKIKKDGPTYKQLDKDCKNLIVDINSVCIKWLKDNHSDLYTRLIKKQQPKVKKSPVVSSEPSSLYYSVDDRINVGETIKNYFQKVVIEEGKACMTQNKTLLKYVDKPKLLGYGSFGNVYAVTLPKTNPPIKSAIKEGRISKSEFIKAMLKQYPMEYLFNKLINDLINDKVCPNFSYTFAIFFCDKCTLNEFKAKPIQTQCSETVVELFDFTLDKLKDLRDEVVLSIFFQLLFAIASIQLEYGMAHYDIKTENILIKVITAGGFWEYTLNGIKYTVPNYGYLVALNDFGVSESFHPGITNDKDYGRRQAEVIFDLKTNNYYFKPFTTKFFPYVKNGYLTRINSPLLPDGKLTYNHFYKNFDSEPSTKLNLEDMAQFPPHLFNFDIMDAVYTFTGGKQTLQPGRHSGLKITSNVSKIFKDFYKVEPDQVWPVDRVDLFLASHTIKKLFSFYVGTKLAGPKIDEYYL